MVHETVGTELTGTYGTNLSWVISKEGLPRRFLVIVGAVLLIDGQDDVSLHSKQNMLLSTRQRKVHASVVTELLYQEALRESTCLYSVTYLLHCHCTAAWACTSITLVAMVAIGGIHRSYINVLIRCCACSTAYNKLEQALLIGGEKCFHR